MTDHETRVSVLHASRVFVDPEALEDADALGLRRGVAPEFRGADRLVPSVEGDEAVLLPRDPDPAHRAAVDARENFAERALRRLDPVERVLLLVAGWKALDQAEGAGCRGEDAAVRGVQSDRAGRLRAAVQPEVDPFQGLRRIIAESVEGPCQP